MGKVYLIAVALILYLLYSFATAPHYIKYDGNINTELEPVQEDISDNKEIIFADYKIIMRAVYKIEALVVSSKSYSYGTESKFAPVDIALAWGKFSEKETVKKVKFSQSGRWYFYEFQDFPLGQEYISSHSSNHHMVPANKNLKRALKKVKKGDKIRAEGYLISIYGENYQWNSSMSRNDTGDGACELVYVEKLVINNREYK